MRILINASLAPSLYNFRGPMIREMVARGFEVHASAPDISASDRDRIRALGATPHALPLQRSGLGVGGDLRYFQALRRLIDQVRPNRVLNYTIKPNIWGSLAARSRGVPAVSMITGLGFVFAPAQGLKQRLVKTLARRLYGFALRRNPAILFQNPDDVADFTAAGLLRDRRRVRMIAGSGIDLVHYSPAPLPDQAVFLMIARYLRAKGIAEYGMACALVRQACPEARCLLVGMPDDGPDGVSEAEVRRLCGGAIEILGQYDDVRRAIAMASVYVLPSYREGTPRSSLEAMAMGRPLITTDVPGCRETVRAGRNGILVPVRNAEALAQAMISLARDPARRAAMGAQSIEIARDHFAVDKVNDIIIETLRSANQGREVN